MVRIYIYITKDTETAQIINSPYVIIMYMSE